jgi:hypothetical protein
VSLQHHGATKSALRPQRLALRRVLIMHMKLWQLYGTTDSQACQKLLTMEYSQWKPLVLQKCLGYLAAPLDGQEAGGSSARCRFP